MKPNLTDDQYITLNNLKNYITDYRKKETLDTLDDDESLIKAIVVESGELLDTITFKYDYHYQQGLEEELADILIYCFALANHKRLDITTIIQNKIEKNKKRDRKYPTKKYPTKESTLNNYGTSD